jgi:hypothetical protein
VNADLDAGGQVAEEAGDAVLPGVEEDSGDRGVKGAP